MGACSRDEWPPMGRWGRRRFRGHPRRLGARRPRAAGLESFPHFSRARARDSLRSLRSNTALLLIRCYSVSVPFDLLPFKKDCG